MSDTERLDWYVRYVADGAEPLSYRRQPDKMMTVTAFGEVTEHDVWHWPMDPMNREWENFREAIDIRMKGKM